MERFEYKITKHPAGTFRELVYFCSESGKCTLEQVPSDQTEILNNILNEQGRQGWELIQLSFGKDGIMAFWKQKLKE
ncbi:MAG: DUF4177 domain-containing protein [Thermodesulfobacteriota bacterium]